MPTVLLSHSLNDDAAAIRALIAEAGASVVDHALGSAPALDFDSFKVAIVRVGDRFEAAAAQTRRWRMELGDQFVPILWVLLEASTEISVAGLDAGADAVLVESAGSELLSAQVRAFLRAKSVAERIATRAAETRLLGEQLRKVHAQLGREWDLGRRLLRCNAPRSFELGMAQFAVAQACRKGSDFLDIQRLDEDRIGFILGDVMGQGSLLGLFAWQAARLREPAPPEVVLERVNRELIGLGREEPPLVGLLAGALHVRDGSLSLARAGLPPPLYLPAEGEPRFWAIPGPYLGTAESTYSPRYEVLYPGDRLLFGTDGCFQEGHAEPILAAAAAHRRTLSGQPFAEALASCLASQAEDATLLSIEILDGPACQD